MNKSLISNGIIVALAIAASFLNIDVDMSVLFSTVFFVIVMAELQCVKEMIKNIPPWY
jgi:hypothetical protein